MAILIYHYARPNTDMMSMYSKSNVLKTSSVSFIMHTLNTKLWGRQLLNGYFSVNNGNNFLTFNCNGNSRHQKTVHLRNGERRLSFDGENRFFHIKVTFTNLHHPQFSTEDNFLKLFLNTQASCTM